MKGDRLLKINRKPDWLKMPTIGNRSAGEVRRILSTMNLNTVCNEARCPNRGHCYERGTATFLILGSVCTRNCAYCAIEKNATSLPPPDPDEPRRIAEASSSMNLKYVVLTSVTRDDLPDGGAGHFAETVTELRNTISAVRVEVLTPDFNGDESALRTIAECRPDVFNHNLETVRRLFPALRPIASYDQSLDVLKRFSKIAPDIPVKSGIMVGLGENADDIEETLIDLKNSGVSLLTIGQYLQPTSKHMPAVRYVEPVEFENWEKTALEIGFAGVASGALVRSSFHADLLAESK
ncbi:MAG: lipoyl synthase [Candidatus Sabulitectum sp.]|nr:lipoyl synthase [Candidatus Sabulitectum sp.]